MTCRQLGMADCQEDNRAGVASSKSRTLISIWAAAGCCWLLLAAAGCCWRLLSCYSIWNYVQKKHTKVQLPPVQLPPKQAFPMRHSCEHDYECCAFQIACCCCCSWLLMAAASLSCLSAVCRAATSSFLLAVSLPYAPHIATSGSNKLETL